MRFPTRAASNIVAGVILAMFISIIWAATMMSLRDWLWFGLFVASITLLIYGRGWVARASGRFRRASRPAVPLVGERERLHEAKARDIIYKRLEATFKPNGHDHHQPKHKL